MTNKLKIKLTKEQCVYITLDSYPDRTLEISEDQIIKDDSVNKNEKTRVVIPRYKIQEAIAELERANCSYYIFSVEEDKIFKEKSNVEKWEEVFEYQGEPHYREIADVLSRWGYNADAAYKEVIGDE